MGGEEVGGGGEMGWSGQGLWAGPPLTTTIKDSPSKEPERLMQPVLKQVCCEGKSLTTVNN